MLVAHDDFDSGSHIHRRCHGRGAHPKIPLNTAHPYPYANSYRVSRRQAKPVAPPPKRRNTARFNIQRVDHELTSFLICLLLTHSRGVANPSRQECALWTMTLQIWLPRNCTLRGLQRVVYWILSFSAFVSKYTLDAFRAAEAINALGLLERESTLDL